MSIRIRNDEEHFGLELTPLIDVVFLLIIFFLVATTFHQMEREIAVVVPKSDTGESGDQGLEPLVINVLEDGRVVFRGNHVKSLENLQSMLTREVNREPKSKALIRAHSQLAFQEVVQVADACRKAKIPISFATLDKKERQ